MTSTFKYVRLRLLILTNVDVTLEFPAVGNSVRDVHSENDYWVEQVVTAYRGQTLGIGGVIALDGIHTLGDGPIFVFTETQREEVEGIPGEKQIGYGTIIQRDVLHEMLHGFGLSHSLHHPDPLHNPGDQGVMNADTEKTGPDSNNYLNPAQIDIIQGVADPGNADGDPA